MITFSFLNILSFFQIHSHVNLSASIFSSNDEEITTCLGTESVLHSICFTEQLEAEKLSLFLLHREFLVMELCGCLCAVPPAANGGSRML